MIVEKLTFEHDDISSNGYCDRIELEIIVRSYDGINSEYDIDYIWNDTKKEYIQYHNLSIDAQLALDMLCRRVSIGLAYDSYKNYLENSRYGGDYD